MITQFPPTSEVGGSNPDPMWESCLFLTDSLQFTVQNLDQLFVLVSSAHKTTCHDMTYTVLKAMLYQNKQIHLT